LQLLFFVKKNIYL